MMNRTQCYASLIVQLSEILDSSKTSPYVFRTRLERFLYKLTIYEKDDNNGDVKELCDQIKNKLMCLSDQSNQTPDGTLNSYLFLKNDLKHLEKLLL